MNQNFEINAQARLEDWNRELRQSSKHAGLLPSVPSLGQQVRQSTGEALIRLGNWIKPTRRGAGRQSANLHTAQMGGR